MVDTASEWEERRKHNPFLAQTKYLDLNMKLLSIGKKLEKKEMTTNVPLHKLHACTLVKGI